MLAFHLLPIDVVILGLLVALFLSVRLLMRNLRRRRP
jgi:hypothetical protein